MKCYPPVVQKHLADAQVRGPQEGSEMKLRDAALATLPDQVGERVVGLMEEMYQSLVEGELSVAEAEERVVELSRELGREMLAAGWAEAGCKTVVGARCKRSGMRWTRSGAQAILTLRCLWLNGRWDEYWQPLKRAA